LKRGRNYWEETVVDVDFGLEVRDDMWVPHGSEGERGSYRFGVLARWATGSFSDLGRGVPRVPFLLFLF
jgi:hypothetical protein